MKILLIIPAYNEADNIGRVIEALKTQCPTYDYVVVNDGSTDDTGRILNEANANAVTHPVNLGLAGAFRTGMKYALKHGYDAAIQFDGDGQHNPEYIAAMAQKIEEGADIVIGSRFVTEKKGWSPRMLGSRLIGGAIFLTTGKRVLDPTSGMRLYSKRLIRVLAVSADFGPEPDTLAFFLRKRYRVEEVPVTMNERTAGKSYLNFGASVAYMARMLVSILLLQWFRKEK